MPKIPCANSRTPPAFLRRRTSQLCRQNISLYACPLTLLRSAPNGRPAPAKGISDGGLTPATDTNMLLTAYKDWSHSSSDITQTGHKHKGTRLISSSPSPTCSFGNVPSPTEFCPPRQDKCRRTPPAPANSGRRFPPPPAESRRTT